MTDSKNINFCHTGCLRNDFRAFRRDAVCAERHRGDRANEAAHDEESLGVSEQNVSRPDGDALTPLELLNVL